VTTIKKLPNGQWRSRPIIEGRKRDVRGVTKAEVERAVAAMKKDAHDRRHGLVAAEKLREDITFDALADEFLAGFHPARERTKQTLAERLKYARAAFGSKNVRDLRAEDIRRWNATLPLGPTTRGHALKAMQRVCQAGFDWRYFDPNRNPAATVSVPRPARRAIAPFESWDQVFAVAEKAGAYGPLIRFACATGLRPQEWQALEWRDITFGDPPRLQVTRTVQSGAIATGAKTDGSLRTVLLQQVALSALHDLPRSLRGGLVFPAPDGGVINLSNFRKRVWKNALTAAGVEYRALDQMRHTFATLSLDAGADPATISKQMGHSDTRMMFKHYLKWLDAANERYITALDAFTASALQTGHKTDTAANADRQT
jgi:integrase